jgi:hypothetical protein
MRNFKVSENMLTLDLQHVEPAVGSTTGSGGPDGGILPPAAYSGRADPQVLVDRLKPHL